MLENSLFTAEEAKERSSKSRLERGKVPIQVVYSIKPNLVTYIFNGIRKASALGCKHTDLVLMTRYSNYILTTLEIGLELLGYSVYYTKDKKQITIKWNN